MLFDFEGRNFDTPTMESAISWREQLLGSLFAHLAAVVLIVLVPRLPFVQKATERRAALFGGSPHRGRALGGARGDRGG